MPLTNIQYDSIRRDYEIRQLNNRHKLERKMEYVYNHVPGYRELENTIASVSVAQGKKLLEGDDSAMEDLREQLAELSGRKTRLLLDAGLPADYLKPVYTCPDCQDTGYINNQKCHCFRQAVITLLYEQSNIQEMLQSENFDTLSYEYYEGEHLSLFKNAVVTCQNFIKNFNSDYHNLFFYGTVGTGKSFLSNCVAKELIENRKEKNTVVSIVADGAEADMDIMKQAHLITNIHLWFAHLLKEGKDPYEMTEQLLQENPDVVMTVNELGCGVVPVDAFDRNWREVTGRICCILAKRAEAVYRMTCGIATKIK